MVSRFISSLKHFSLVYKRINVLSAKFRKEQYYLLFRSTMTHKTVLKRKDRLISDTLTSKYASSFGDSLKKKCLPLLSEVTKSVPQSSYETNARILKAALKFLVFSFESR